MAVSKQMAATERKFVAADNVKVSLFSSHHSLFARAYSNCWSRGRGDSLRWITIKDGKILIEKKVYKVTKERRDTIATGFKNVFLPCAHRIPN